MSLFAVSLLAFAFSSENVEIVCAPEAPRVVRDTATFLKAHLDGMFGVSVPVRAVPTDGRRSIVLGDNAWSRAAGIDPSAVARDGFVLKASGDRLYVCGVDDPTAELLSLRSPRFERGTYHGAIEILERLGCRFYFPGELGTVVPKRTAADLGDLDEKVVPRFVVRAYSSTEMGAWPWADTNNLVRTQRKQEHYRLRFETMTIPCCHGLYRLGLVRRFAKTHPEYFALRADGTRMTGPEMQEQICPSSAVWDEIYKDAKSYFSGEDASVRGIPAFGKKTGCAWNANAVGRKYFDIMPNDGMARCHCERCRRLPSGQWASRPVWSNTVAIARRLKAEGVKGTITQMVYSPYREVPDFDLPDNVAVMVAETGPWSLGNPAKLAKDNAQIRAWGEKAGGRVWLWNYAGKFACFNLNIPDVPQVSPRAIAAYYRDIAPLTMGAFLETTSDRFLYDYLNYYVFAKVCWNPQLDVEALLDEHDRLMFGAGAKPMGTFFRIFERKWVYGICGRIVDTPIGPTCVPPTALDLWTKVYDDATVAELRGALDAATDAVPSGSLERRRLDLFRREHLDRLVARREAYLDGVLVGRERAWRASHPDRSILVNGDFEETDLSMWKSSVGTVSRDTTTSCSGKASLKLVATDGRNQAEGPFLRAEVTQMLDEGAAALKPNTRYRLSYFVRYENVRPVQHAGGVSACLCDLEDVAYPENCLQGTTDWIRQAFIFTTSDKSRSERPYLRLRLSLAVGTVWFDGVRLEEVTE